MNYVLLKEKNKPKSLKDKFFDNKCIDLSEDDLGLILDAIYEQANYKSIKTGTWDVDTEYTLELLKIGKKISKLMEEK